MAIGNIDRDNENENEKDENGYQSQSEPRAGLDLPAVVRALLAIQPGDTIPYQQWQNYMGPIENQGIISKPGDIPYKRLLPQPLAQAQSQSQPQNVSKVDEDDLTDTDTDAEFDQVQEATAFKVPADKPAARYEWPDPRPLATQPQPNQNKLPLTDADWLQIKAALKPTQNEAARLKSAWATSSRYELFRSWITIGIVVCVFELFTSNLLLPSLDQLIGKEPASELFLLRLHKLSQSILLFTPGFFLVCSLIILQFGEKLDFEIKQFVGKCEQQYCNREGGNSVADDLNGLIIGRERENANETEGKGSSPLTR